MSVYLWFLTYTGHFYNIVLFDGENTYWDDEMRPSKTPEKRLSGKICKVTKSKYVYIGEL